MLVLWIYTTRSLYSTAVAGLCLISVPSRRSKIDQVSHFKLSMMVSLHVHTYPHGYDNYNQLQTPDSISPEAKMVDLVNGQRY